MRKSDSIFNKGLNSFPIKVGIFLLISLVLILCFSQPALASKEQPAPLKQQIDLTKVLTKETKKELERAGQLDEERREIVQAEDTFLIQFELKSEKGVNMNQLVKEYKQVPVVIDAQYVTRR